MSLRLKDLPPAMRKAALAVDQPAAVPVRRPPQKRPAELPVFCYQCKGEPVPYAQLEKHMHQAGHCRRAEHVLLLAPKAEP